MLPPMIAVLTEIAILLMQQRPAYTVLVCLVCRYGILCMSCTVCFMLYLCSCNSVAQSLYSESVAKLNDRISMVISCWYSSHCWRFHTLKLGLDH